jgi:eukaryotic-like serine/threonine-protein kinase
VTTTSAEFQPEVRLGEIVDMRYRIVAHLGTGGMASVYRGEHVHTAAQVAIKVLLPALNDNPEVSARFRREALAARSIKHPNVVSIFDIGKLTDGCSFMVLEYLAGEDLFALLEREKPLAQLRAVSIALQIAHALVTAHAAGVIHRDLKPDNIMLIERGGERDVVKVVDFGIAKVPVNAGPALTALGSVFGTPEYMAPEQARGAAVDARTDLYTLGTVLYEMLAGRTPFAHCDFGQMLLSQISKSPPPLPPEIDPELAGVVMRLLAKSPDERVQTAAELHDCLRAIQARMSGHPSPRAALPVVQATAPAPSVSPRAPGVAMRPAISPQTAVWNGWVLLLVALVVAFVLARVIVAIF